MPSAHGNVMKIEVAGEEGGEGEEEDSTADKEGQDRAFMAGSRSNPRRQEEYPGRVVV